MTAPRDPLLDLAYQQLRRVAGRILQGESGVSLQPTELVHEAWIRLDAQQRPSWTDQRHFCAIAALAMRRILVDHARRKRADKRGGGLRRVTLSGLPGTRDVDLLDLEALLARLEARAPRQAEVAVLKVFGGLSAVEIAGHLQVSERTVQSDWRAVKAWLSTQLEPG